MRKPSVEKLDALITEGDELRVQTTMWLSPAEKDLIRRAARRAGTRMGTFLRERALSAARKELGLEV